MIRPRLSAVALLAALLAPVAAPARDAPKDWRSVATEADRTRIHNWRQAFTKALATARASGNGDAIDAEGPLLRPDSALEMPAPPVGAYLCRSFRIGAAASGMRDFVSSQPLPCRIEETPGGLRFVQREGVQQPAGRLYPDGALRMVFLGTMRLADEAHRLDYGRDPDRSLGGLFERIAPGQWRIVLPFPRWESTLQVIELRAAGD